ncbi:MAG: 16S rRNA (adenine(1518)-N(6)/adenine(1519)-N(6))-dimethyltransferase RsmA [Pseudomonadota bacterium]
MHHLPALREVIAQHNLRADKSYGQNFLLDQNLTDKIARAAGDLTGKHVLEIGPGPGGLTRSLLRTPATAVTAVEIDPRAVAALKELQDIAGQRFQLLAQDALHAGLTDLVPHGPRAIVANLPYNIATPLLIKWLMDIHADNGSIDVMVLMFQKEVAQRICAVPRTSAYGRLAIMAQWLCDTRIAFDVPASAFVPPPKVTSSIVVLRPRRDLSAQPEFTIMEKLVARAFQQRRKMLRNTLAPFLAQLEQCGIPETARPEEVTPAQYVALSRLIPDPSIS